MRHGADCSSVLAKPEVCGRVRGCAGGMVPSGDRIVEYSRVW